MDDGDSVVPTIVFVGDGAERGKDQQANEGLWCDQHGKSH
jgi:hypothetical protein